MFTGIIEDLGRIKRISTSSRGSNMEIFASKIIDDLKIGDSVAVNGVCLTVAQFESGVFCADVMPETFKKTNLGELNIGDKVNLERALKASDRFGGHLVLGHVDGVGRILNKRREGNSELFKISAPGDIADYLVLRGSIAVDGISLTIIEARSDSFSVSVIPHTVKATTLGDRTIASGVNLEADIIGKYVKAMLSIRDSSGSTLELLTKYGYLEKGGVR